MRILIVDDRPRSCKGLRALFATFPGVQVIAEASNGLEAIQLVEKHHPDAVLMDICMPVMNGLDATRVIKEKWPEVRVVVLTIHLAQKVDALAAGADAFLVKGCPVDELLAAITHLGVAQ